MNGWVGTSECMCVSNCLERVNACVRGLKGCKIKNGRARTTGENNRTKETLRAPVPPDITVERSNPHRERGMPTPETFSPRAELGGQRAHDTRWFCFSSVPLTQRPLVSLWLKTAVDGHAASAMRQRLARRIPTCPFSTGSLRQALSSGTMRLEGIQQQK